MNKFELEHQYMDADGTPFKVVDRYTTTVIEVSNPNYPSGKVETCLVKTDMNGDEYIERYTEYFQEADCSATEEVIEDD